MCSIYKDSCLGHMAMHILLQDPKKRAQTSGRPRPEKDRLEQTRLQRFHLAANRSRPTEELATPRRESRGQNLPLRQPLENGYHNTFEYPRFKEARDDFLSTRKTWEELDLPVWRKEGDEDPYDAIESFFSYIHRQMSQTSVTARFHRSEFPFVLSMLRFKFLYTARRRGPD